MCGYLEQLREVCDSARRDHLIGFPYAFNLCCNHIAVEMERFCDPVEEIGAKPARFDQCDRPIDQASDHDSREAGPRSNIQPRGILTGLEAYKLRRIQDVTGPEIIKRGSRNEVLPVALLSQEGRVGLNFFERFT
jgi:hypothetical protein